ncbi:MAG: UvrD-helicase domain-containing protein [Muribaculaceae bacterium]|nr:UvrD-helicase domain-containing protein [Muribaculaceae bacterium]
MLQLQRASAGSGKTYTLAKKFIEYYISRPDETGRRHLRPVRALRESLQHILAITFTNKATNEMKLRIVDKLHALASWTPATPITKIDYLKDFTEQFSCSPQEIAYVCRQALKVLLTDYGDFKVSTIDSFFQTVLRTFAYEADLDDTYQLELDSNYVTQMGLDTTLDEIDAEGHTTQGAVWVENMMENKAASGKGWNIFQKKQNRNSVYGEILNASRNLAKEDFKEIRESLDKYFEDNPDFFKTFHQLCRHYEQPQREAFDRMREAARAVRDAFNDAGLDMALTAGQYLEGRVMKMIGKWDWDQPIDKKSANDFPIPEFTRKGSRSRVFDPKKQNPYLGTPVEDHIQELAEEMYRCFDIWRKEALSDRMKRWRIYRATMPYVGLLQSVRNNARLFLTDSNTVELGETNSILHRIIGDDDAPFVYERLGSRLEHFLIDEFQDTSKLQWLNLSPLLTESESKGHDNLIIGDAKQSIYRFRNADPGLITSTVPKQFADTCRECGNSPAENTNWRSSMRIVKFNNLFFRYFSRELGDRMERLYSNTVQPPSHKEDVGFVSVRLFDNTSDDQDFPPHFDEIPLLISEMLDRGYRMNEIAVLVDTHDQGTKIIERIMLYNQQVNEDRKINFISADSLHAGESPAVQTVMSILEAINNGTRATLNPKEERGEKGAGDWSRLRADFSFFAMRHPDTALSELLSRFLDGEYNPDAIRDMLAGMSTTVLPALVENIIQHFIPVHSRRSEAAFLAALQDMVVEFCEGYTADIASFLQWWDKKGRFRSVSSPEDADAVNIMTVHKSKGLEFRCVIVPFSKQTVRPMSPQQKEWLWVRPDLSDAEGIPHIPWIPVWSVPKLEETIHADIYREYLDNFMADKVNMAYVAYTRAIDELYIYSPCKLNDDGTVPDSPRIGSYLWKCGAEAEEVIDTLKEAYSDVAEYFPSSHEISVDTVNKIWSYGEPLSKEKIEAGHKKKEDDHVNLTVSEYRCGTVIPALVYSDPTSPDSDTFPSDPDDTDTEEQETEETRRYGELMHSIMENINTAGDIPHALLSAKSKGYIGLRQMEQLTVFLTEALESVKEYGWFSPGCRILNERGIVADGKVRRPDRIILRKDGSAVIVDYKFGNHRNDRSYTRQLKRYVSALVQTGIAKKCEAYIWYVSLGEVVSIKD